MLFALNRVHNTEGGAHEDYVSKSLSLFTTLITSPPRMVMVGVVNAVCEMMAKIVADEGIKTVLGVTRACLGQGRALKKDFATSLR